MIPALPAHAKTLAVIHAAAFPPAETWDARTFAIQLGLPGTFGLIEREAGLVLARVAADEAEILTLAVLPAARRRGVGTALLRAAMQGAAGDGARAMFLEVSAGNDAARALYGTAGFRPVGRRCRYYADGAAALVLTAPLSAAAATDASPRPPSSPAR